MEKITPTIHDSWKEVLLDEFQQPYFLQLKNFLTNDKQTYTIYPPGSLIFNAFNSTPFDQVKVVLLGQDPYHGSGQAHGLCFSVPKGIPAPPSLVNMFKELKSDLGIPVPPHGNLEKWAQQGVLLLNTSLTVRAGMALSHQGKGWEQFTDKVIKTLSERRKGLVFILWGRNAKAKEAFIDTSKHFILTAAHPSPLSAYNGFFGCKHFSKTNKILEEQGFSPIDWAI
jgi:uracil-DNA glycosylase